MALAKRDAPWVLPQHRHIHKAPRLARTKTNVELCTQDAKRIPRYPQPTQLYIGLLSDTARFLMQERRLLSQVPVSLKHGLSTRRRLLSRKLSGGQGLADEDTLGGPIVHTTTKGTQCVSTKGTSTLVPTRGPERYPGLKCTCGLAPGPHALGRSSAACAGQSGPQAVWDERQAHRCWEPSAYQRRPRRRGTTSRMITPRTTLPKTAKRTRTRNDFMTTSAQDDKNARRDYASLPRQPRARP